MMDNLPPRDRLRQVAGSLVRYLPEQFGVLLAAERFDDARGALARLSDPRTLARSVAHTEPEEAAWLAELLLERWARIDDIRLEPAAAIVGPEEIWLAQNPQEITYAIAVSEVADQWSAQWSGDAVPDPTGRQGVLIARPPEADTPAQARITVRVMGRSQGRRCILTADRIVPIRRPVVSLDESRKRLLVGDQTGAPASGVSVRIDEQSYTTQPNGLIELPRPLSPEAKISVEEAVVRVVVPPHQ